MYLYGASGHAKVIVDILKSQHVGISGLFDDNRELKFLMNFPVKAFSSDLLSNEELIISIGNNTIRKKIVDSLSDQIRYGTAFASTAQISEFADIDAGTVVMQGAIIQAGTKTGKHCIINTHASVDHDCRISDYVHISPHACLCGGVTVGEGTHIGAGAVVIPGIRIGRWSVIGAGSVVIRDVPDGVTVVGNPARPIR